MLTSGTGLTSRACVTRVKTSAAINSACGTAGRLVDGATKGAAQDQLAAAERQQNRQQHARRRGGKNKRRHACREAPEPRPRPRGKDECRSQHSQDTAHAKFAQGVKGTGYVEDREEMMIPPSLVGGNGKADRRDAHQSDASFEDHPPAGRYLRPHIAVAQRHERYRRPTVTNSPPS